MKYANTSNIKLKKFPTENDARDFLEKMVAAHKTELTKRWKKGPLNYSFFDGSSKAKSKVRILRANFVGLYESDIINEVKRNLRPEIEKELKKSGNADAGASLNHVIVEIETDLIKGIEQTRPKFKQIVRTLLNNSVNAKWWVRRNIERDRIAAACSIFDGTGKVETSDLNENPFGDGTDKPILDEEYCLICKKLIAENDKSINFSGTDYVACSSFCHSKGRGSVADEWGKYPHFHNCSTCSRFIPKSIGENCRTCQKKSQGSKTGICYTCKKNKPIAGKKRGTNQEYCQECLNAIPLCAVCGKKCWGKANNAPGTKFKSTWEGKDFFFNSETCFKQWEKNKKNPPKPNLAQLKIKYLNELTGLSDWHLLTEDEKDQFKKMITGGFFETQFKNAISQAQILITQRKKENGDEEDNNKDQAIQQAIAAVISVLRDNNLEKDQAKIEAVLGKNWEASFKGMGKEIDIEKLKNTFIQKIKDFVAQNKSNFLDIIKEIEETLQKVGLSEKILGEDWKTKFEGKSEVEINTERERLLKLIEDEVNRQEKEGEIGQGDAKNRKEAIIENRKEKSKKDIDKKLKEGHQKLSVKPDELPVSLFAPYKTCEEKLNSLNSLEEISDFNKKLVAEINNKKEEKLGVIQEETISKIEKELGNIEIELGQNKDFKKQIRETKDPDVIELIEKNLLTLIREQKAERGEENISNNTLPKKTSLAKTIGIAALIVLPFLMVGMFIVLQIRRRKLNRER